MISRQSHAFEYNWVQLKNNYTHNSQKNTWLHFVQLLDCYLYNYSVIELKCMQLLVQIYAWFVQVLQVEFCVMEWSSQPSRCHSGNGKGNGLWFQLALCIDFHPIYVATNTLLLSWPVSRYLALDGVPTS